MLFFFHMTNISTFQLEKVFLMSSRARHMTSYFCISPLLARRAFIPRYLVLTPAFRITCLKEEYALVSLDWGLGKIQVTLPNVDVGSEVAPSAPCSIILSFRTPQNDILISNLEHLHPSTHCRPTHDQRRSRSKTGVSRQPQRLEIYLLYIPYFSYRSMGMAAV